MGAVGVNVKQPDASARLLQRVASDAMIRKQQSLRSLVLNIAGSKPAL